MVQFCYLRLYLGIETVSCRSFATDGRDGHELKLENDGPTFSSFNANGSKKKKTTKKIYATGAFGVWVNWHYVMTSP